MPPSGIDQETIGGHPSGSENTHRCCRDQRGETASPLPAAPAEGRPRAAGAEPHPRLRQGPGDGGAGGIVGPGGPPRS